MRIMVYSCDGCGTKLPDGKYPATAGWFTLQRRPELRTEEWAFCSIPCVNSWSARELKKTAEEKVE